MFTQSAMHFCAWRYLLASFHFREGGTSYLELPPSLQLASAFFLGNACVIAYANFTAASTWNQATPPHTAPSKPYPPSLFLSSYLSQLFIYFFFDCTFTFVAFTHLFSSCWQTLLPPRSTSPYLHCTVYPHPPSHSTTPSLLRSFFAFVTWAHFHCQRQRCTRHLHSNFCLAALEMQLPIPPLQTPPLPHHRTPCAV